MCLDFFAECIIVVAAAVAVQLCSCMRSVELLRLEYMIVS